MKNFVAPSPDLGSSAVRSLRTRDDAATLAALKAMTPPFADEVAVELIALAYAAPTTLAHPLGRDLRKHAKKLVDRHVADAAQVAVVFKGMGARTHEVDERLRGLAPALRNAIARAIVFHSWNAISIPFEEDAAFRGAILDLAVERAKRDDEPLVLLGEIYTAWHGSHGSATSTNLHALPDALADELAARRHRHPFIGFSVHGGSLTDLPAGLARANGWLTHLSLAYNPFAALPEVVLELSNLETLELAGTTLGDLPVDLRKLRKLRRLDIGNGKRMVTIPETVCALDQVRELRIGNGSIKHIPDAIAAMTSLEVLEMQSTRITKLPAVIATLPNLRLVKARFSRLDAARARALLPAHVKLAL